MILRELGQRWVPLGERFVEALQEQISAARNDDPLGPITVVLPSFHSAFFLRRRIAASEPLFNVQFLRLEDFAETLVGTTDSRPSLSRLRASEIIHAVATDGSVALPEEFRRIREQDGFQTALHRTLDDLDAAGVDSGSGAFDAVDGGWRFTSAVLALYDSYRERASGFAAASLTAGMAAEAIRSNTPGLKRFGHVVLALIEEPAAQHRDLVSALVSRSSTSALIGSTGESESDRLMSQIPGLIPPPDDIADKRSAPEFRLISAPDPAEEARWVVRDVLAAGREATRFARIGVFFEDASYGPRLTETFQLSKVPVSGPSPVTLGSTPNGRWILGLLATLDPEHAPEHAGAPGQTGKEGFARASLAAWVTGSHVLGADGQPAAGAAWDVISRKANVVSGAAKWDEKLAAHAGRLRSRADKAERQEEDASASVSGWLAEADQSDRLRAFVRQLASEPLPSSHGASWSDYVVWLRKHAECYGRAGILTDDDDEEGQAVSSALDAIGELDSLDLPSPTFGRFRRTLQQELDRPLSRVGRLGSGVFVAPLRQAAGCDFDRVYIVGMAEGSYPAIGSEDPLLPDRIRSGIPGLKTLGDQRASARRRYLTALGSAQKRILVWPRSQPGATRQVGPARWLTEAAEIIHGKALPPDLLKANGLLEIVPPAARQSAETEPVDRYEYELRSLAAWSASGRSAEQHFLFTEPGETLSTGRELERSRFQARRLTRWDGSIGPNVGPDVTWSPKSLSVIASSTRLEAWASCPFKYFLTYEVGVEPTETPEAAETLSALDRGSIIHEILDKFIGDKLDQPISNAEDDGEHLRRVISEHLDTFEKNGLTGRPVLWRLERERITRGLLDFLDVHRSRIQERGQRPVATELGFGDGQKVPAVVVQLPGGRQIRFRGWIDRVDADGSNATVIDYKSGRGSYFSKIADDPVDGGKHLQLPIYALAVKQWRPNADSIDAEFWFVMDDAGSAKVGTSLEAAAPRFEQVVNEIVSGIEEGVFPAYPGQGSIPTSSGGYAPANCAYCPYDRICPGGRAWAWERKSADPAVARFVGLSSDDGKTTS